MVRLEITDAHRLLVRSVHSIEPFSLRTTLDRAICHLLIPAMHGFYICFHYATSAPNYYTDEACPTTNSILTSPRCPAPSFHRDRQRCIRLVLSDADMIFGCKDQAVIESSCGNMGGTGQLWYHIIKRECVGGGRESLELHFRIFEKVERVAFQRQNV